MDTDKLLVLHGHFLAADAIKQSLFAEVPVNDAVTGKLGGHLPVAQFWSATMRLQVFYALLYVVVEGYREFGCDDTAVDALLADDDRVQALRRFRNAVFHPQAEPLSPKLTGFLNAEGSEQWTGDLHKALKRYFESQLRIKEFLNRLSEDQASNEET